METNGDKLPCYVTKKRMWNRKCEINHFRINRNERKNWPYIFSTNTIHYVYSLYRKHNNTFNKKAHSSIAKTCLEAKSNMNDKLSIHF